MNESFVKRIGGQLEEIRSAGLFKTERIISSEQGVEIVVKGRKLLNFCANNYLGLSSNPDVIEAAVIGVPDEKWDERPLACVVLKEGSVTTIDQLRAFLVERVAKWWVPERWAFIDEVPKTSVGKFDKKVLRVRREHNELQIIEAASNAAS